MKDGRPKVSDFGLAKRLDSDDDLTEGSGPLGSPPYMAPEQTGRNQGAIDARTDVYGLGATLYHLVTGRRPFTGLQDEVISKVRSEPPIPPRSVRREVPRELEAIGLKILEKEPFRRYQNGGGAGRGSGQILGRRQEHRRTTTDAITKGRAPGCDGSRKGNGSGSGARRRCSRSSSPNCTGVEPLLQRLRCLLRTPTGKIQPLHAAPETGSPTDSGNRSSFSANSVLDLGNARMPDRDGRGHGTRRNCSPPSESAFEAPEPSTTPELRKKSRGPGVRDTRQQSLRSAVPQVHPPTKGRWAGRDRNGDVSLFGLYCGDVLLTKARGTSRIVSLLIHSRTTTRRSLEQTCLNSRGRPRLKLHQSFSNQMDNGRAESSVWSMCCG